jgi:HlyD family secretion protein
VANGSDRAVLGQLHTLFNVGAIRELTDGQLLERFASDARESAELAFAVLIERHGAMVLRVCQGVLMDPHDTQDAFQATFLVLVQKARALWVRDSLGPWLHQVAYRTAMCARLTAARRRRHERCAAGMFQEIRVEPNEERSQVLHEEISRLPGRFQAPVVLCDLEGRTHEQAARHLKWPIGTVKSRLSRARERLRANLIRRGLAPNAGLLVTALPSAGTQGLMTPALVESTTGMALRFASGRAIVPGSVTTLAQGVLRTMSITRWFKAATILLVLSVSASGVEPWIPQDKPSTDAAGVEKRPPSQVGNLPVATVHSGKLVATLVDRGVLESSQPHNVFCDVEGVSTILELVADGTRVQKGDVVCVLDSPALREKLSAHDAVKRTAEAEFLSAKLLRDVAESKLREYLEGTFPRELKAVKGEIAATESAIQKANVRLERTRRTRKLLTDLLAAKGSDVTTSDLLAELEVEDRVEAAEQTLVREKIALDVANANLARLEKFSRESVTRELKGDLERKQSDFLVKESDHRREAASADNLREQIDNCKLRAPETGIVVYANEQNRVASRPPIIALGSKVRERQIIFSVPDVAHLRVSAKIPESRIAQIRRGQGARITVDTFPEKTFSGVVASMNTMPDATNLFSAGTNVYTTRIALDNPIHGLRPGLSAEVEILIGELDNVLSVPVSAVIPRDGKSHVAVSLPGGGFAWREVTLGLSNDKLVEIQRGIQSGEKVILDPQALMSEPRDRATKKRD